MLKNLVTCLFKMYICFNSYINFFVNNNNILFIGLTHRDLNLELYIMAMAKWVAPMGNNNNNNFK